MKITIGLFCGGKSTEHEISLLSAKSILNAINYDKYELKLIAIDKMGDWYLLNKNDFIEENENAGTVKLKVLEENKIALIPKNNSNRIISINTGEDKGKIDIAFPVIHGTTGEDGGLQGYFNMLNLPFIGCDILGSAVGMDKETSKIIAEKAGILVAKYFVLREGEKENINYNTIIKELNFPIFVKPVALGSSVGIKKANNHDELTQSIKYAFKFDSKIIVEECISGREIECAVLGNDNILASVPGEVIPKDDFYSYQAKYIDSEGAKLEMPAKISEEQTKKLKELAVKTFKALNGIGLARVDFFLTKENKFIFNEINTLPGFTKTSMYPKLFELSGIKYPDLIDKLIELGFNNHIRKTELVNNLKFIT